MNRYHLFLFVTLLIVVGCGAPAETAVPTVPLDSCQLAGQVEAECGAIAVPVDRSAVDGRTIDVHFAVIPATTSVAEPDPVFMLAGGPGQAATEVYPLILSQLGSLRQNRDIVLVDQRGTGQSNPLTCPNLLDLPLDVSVTAFQEEIENCRQELAQENDLTRYTTAIAMADLDAVRAALGYEQINLIGTSYGTRAALEYMRQFPEQVRSVVLNSVAGPELVLQLQAPRDGQRALEMLFARCAAEAACREAFPDLEAEFDALLAQLADEEVVTLTDPVSGERMELKLEQDAFMSLIFTALYSAEIVSILPLLIHEAHLTGDLSPLVAQGLAVTTGVNFYQGMLYAVVCSEDAPLIDLEEAAVLQQGTDFGLVAENLVNICVNWSQGPVPDDFREPTTVAIPTLLLSGEADPVTPPRYAEQVAAALPNSAHVLVPDYGHDVLIVGCVPRLVNNFITSGTVNGLKTDCVNDVQAPPFFVSPAGPMP